VIVASVPNMHVRRVFFLEIAVLVGFSLQHGGAAARVSRRHTPPMSTSGCLVAVAWRRPSPPRGVPLFVA